MIFKESEGKPSLVKNSLCPEKQWDMDPEIMTQSILHLYRDSSRCPQTAAEWSQNQIACQIFLLKITPRTATVRFPGQAHRYHRHKTLYPVKLPPTFDWHSSHTPQPVCISLDISTCKTPRKHVRLRWKSRCLQTGKEIWYLSHQVKWTWQMYFWLKLKLWDLSCYPGDAARCTACVWQRGTPWSFEPGCGFQQFITSALQRGSLPKYWTHRSRPVKGVWKWFLSTFPSHRPPHYQGKAMERKWMESTIFDSGLPKMVSISN